MINHRHSFIFIHINKCGGTTIDTVLGGGFRGHAKIRSYISRRRAFSHYFKFAFVRNPWDRMVSFYHYQLQNRWRSFPTLKSRARSGKDDISFDEFIKTWMSKKNRGTSLNTHSCYSWLTDFEGNLAVDFVGRFENFQQDFDFVCDKINFPRQPLLHENKSNHDHYTEYYNEETIQIVAERFAEDVEHFGYEFGK